MAERQRDYDRFYFETLYAGHADPWSLASEPERRKHLNTISMLGDRRFDRALELGCGEGAFTTVLAPVAGELIAVDISQIALERAKARCIDIGHVDFRRLDLVDDPLPGGFDLVVCSEVLYYVEAETLPAVVEKIVDALVPGGLILSTHLNVASEEPKGVLVPFAFGAKTVAETLLATERLSVVDEVDCTDYRIAVFQRRC